MLDSLITSATLKDLAGAAAFRRGEEYFSSGAVERLGATAAKITARVQGTETYQVELRDVAGELDYDCTCPRAADGYFCKHCVAVGLAWLADQPVDQKSGRPAARKKRRDPWGEIKKYLTTQSQEVLLELLLEVAQRDDRLYQSLLLKAERRSGGGDVAKVFRRAIDSATRIDGFVDWREVGTFAGNIEQVADSLAELLKPETVASLVELAEYAIARVENALEQLDDSNGQIGEIVYALGALHLKACTMARPNPVGLAERLFRLETTLPFGLCSFDAVTYRDSLGGEGLHRYRELAEAEWRKFKPRRPGDSYDGRRATITGIMERLAEASGDIEELVAIKARDLSSGYHYLAIAEIWAKAKQLDKALDWAERGLKAFPARPDNRLRDFLVVEYLKRRRHDEALQLTWIQFEEQPSLQHYKKLNSVAGKLGIWLEQRQQALGKVAEEITRVATTTNYWKPKPSSPNTTLRVEIALWEKDLDAAWMAAQEGICDRNLLITLAGKLEATRPGGAIALYCRVVVPIVEQTNNTAYAEAIKLVRKVGKLQKAQNQAREFTDYLDGLRVQFKPKRNFIKLLDGVAHSAQ